MPTTNIYRLSRRAQVGDLVALSQAEALATLQAVLSAPAAQRRRWPLHRSAAVEIVLAVVGVVLVVALYGLALQSLGAAPALPPSPADSSSVQRPSGMLGATQEQ
ncbi:MAG: hypothetical protein L0K86_21130 [Actinomycetia bacterium]|nr:hypothetical protein [Actinomycetes bacterium]